MSGQDGRRSGALPASEEGTGLIPEDGTQAGDTGKPASEADELAPENGEPQSWPGTSFGSIPPPG